MDHRSKNGTLGEEGKTWMGMKKEEFLCSKYGTDLAFLSNPVSGNG